ncbi:MAG TPA: methylated-DNA--[protein]-cysteine S-methyltransferase [Kofleriaceae bacterium]|nr:methylated-DNA--[protein]-cysteine S-methyltransferase [Kofleriaceae bacterium]
MKMIAACYSAPFGTLRLDARGDELVALWLPNAEPPDVPVGSSRVLARAATQLDEYFAGTRRTFDLPLAPHGTGFQQRVWRALCAIPFGATSSYGELARAIGRPAASRAVGAANGRNPIAIIVPCHRVIGANGTLTGYGGGLATKAWLLDHERRHAGPQLELPPRRLKTPSRQRNWIGPDPGLVAPLLHGRLGGK